MKLNRKELNSVYNALILHCAVCRARDVLIDKKYWNKIINKIGEELGYPSFEWA